MKMVDLCCVGLIFLSMFPFGLSISNFLQGNTFATLAYGFTSLFLFLGGYSNIQGSTNLNKTTEDEE